MTGGALGSSAPGSPCGSPWGGRRDTTPTGCARPPNQRIGFKESQAWTAAWLGRGVRDRAGLSRDHRSFGGVAARCAVVASRLAMTRSPWVSQIVGASGAAMATGTVKWFNESASSRLTPSHPLRQCPSCPACLATCRFSVSARLRSATWRFGDKLGHQLGRHHRRDRRTLLLRTSSIPDAGGQGDARP